MRLTRVHIETPLSPGSRVQANGSASNHVTRVLRLRTGDAVTVFDGRGGEYEAVIADIRRDTVMLEVHAYRGVERESPLQITLAQGVSRGERMDWVVQKATELGVTRIVPLLTERSVVHLDERQSLRKVEHWRAIAIAACEQCGRNRVPRIEPPGRLPEFLQARSRDSAGLLLSPEGSHTLSQVAAGVHDVTVLIGPEGGLAAGEQDIALGTGFTAVRLGPRILRTETAAVAALTVLQQMAGDL